MLQQINMHVHALNKLLNLIFKKGSQLVKGQILKPEVFLTSESKTPPNVPLFLFLTQQKVLSIRPLGPNLHPNLSS